MKGLNDTANTKEGTDGPNWRRLTRIAIAVFEKLLGWTVFKVYICCGVILSFTSNFFANVKFHSK